MSDGVKANNHYWDAVADEWRMSSPQKLWRKHSDAVNLKLLAQWLTGTRKENLLKTDLFDEAVSEGLLSRMIGHAQHVIGIDISIQVIQAALSMHKTLKTVNADARNLPFGDRSVDIIVSTSTVDHFKTKTEIMCCLREFYRILRENGQLIITIDNPLNPIIGLRNILPYRLLYELHMVPYITGKTLGPSQFSRELNKIGFEIKQSTAIVHCPRFLAIKLAAVIGRNNSMKSFRQFLKVLMIFEKFAQLPTRFLTGHFVAVHAVKC